ncbi:MAG: acyloxyacyl hydrolase [Bacteroidales bacterium]|nr:acyloxyacyl hydrolase [Bacteroidales bacterium]
MKKLYILLIISIVSTTLLQSQEISRYEPEEYKEGPNSGHFNYIELKFHAGSHPNTSKYIEELLAAGYKALEIRVGTQGTGRKPWQRVHNYPQYGVGFFLANLGPNQLDTIVGTPSGIFGYIGIPWIRKNRFRLNTDLSAGLSYDFEPYDAETNPYNDVIGSWMNVYFNLNLVAYWQISERLDISLGWALSHFSNGRWRTPNKGMNLMGYNVGLAYNFNPFRGYERFKDPEAELPVRPEFIREPIPALEKYSEIRVMGSVGTSTTSGDPAVNEAGPRYFNSSWYGEFSRRFWWRGNYTAGLDFFFDGSLVEGYNKPHDQVSFFEKTTYGAHIGHDLLIERFTLITQIGFYIYKETEERGSYYIRAGGRMALNDRWNIHVCLKTMNGGIADWIEWGVSRNFRLKKKG